MSKAMTDLRFELDAAPGPDSLAQMAEAIRLLDEAAERAAAQVSEAADGLRGGPGSDFHAQLVADLGEAVVERVNEIHDECERLSGMLARATKLSARRGAPSPAPTPITEAPDDVLKTAIGNGSASVEPRPGPARAPAERRLDRRRSPGQSTPEGVRLAATQMAVAGSSRSEIERCLRIQFGVRDADAALDEIFGTRPSEVR